MEDITTIGAILRTSFIGLLSCHWMNRAMISVSSCLVFWQRSLPRLTEIKCARRENGVLGLRDREGQKGFPDHFVIDQ